MYNTVSNFTSIRTLRCLLIAVMLVHPRVVDLDSVLPESIQFHEQDSARKYTSDVLLDIKIWVGPR